MHRPDQLQKIVADGAVPCATVVGRVHSSRHAPGRRALHPEAGELRAVDAYEASGHACACGRAKASPLSPEDERLAVAALASLIAQWWESNGERESAEKTGDATP